MDLVLGVAVGIGLALSIVTIGMLALESFKMLNGIRTRLVNTTSDLRGLMKTVQCLSALLLELQDGLKNDLDVSANLYSLWRTQFQEIEKDLGHFGALMEKLVEKHVQISAFGLKIRLRAEWVFSEGTLRR